MHIHKSDAEKAGLIIFLAGLSFCVYLNAFWPWFLIVMGLTQLPIMLSRRQSRRGSQFFILLSGLALLFHFNQYLLPGIVLLVAVIFALETLFRRHKRHSAKHSSSGSGSKNRRSRSASGSKHHRTSKSGRTGNDNYERILALLQEKSGQNEPGDADDQVKPDSH